uniref:Serine/threonine-protein kinase Chk2 n=1 Tax=Ciona intestinalis TaxID=7719 RepID=F6WMB2_CIOIN
IMEDTNDERPKEKNASSSVESDKEKMRSPASLPASQEKVSSSSGTGTSSGNTVSSADTVPTQEITDSQGVELEPVWGVLHSMQPEFYSLNLRDEQYTFGRANSCDYCFDIKTIKSTSRYKHYSKRHFAIRRVKLEDETYQVFIEDFGGQNGVYVNGVKIPSGRKQTIKTSDEIGIAYNNFNVFLFIDKEKDSDLEVSDEFSKKYITHKLLGKGACGQVWEVWERFCAGKFAVKIISKTYLSVSPSSKDVIKEADILRKLSHPCIIGVHDVVDLPQNLYIVLEFAKGGELFKRLEKGGKLPEKIAKLYFFQMLSAVKYLHDNEITHRDLKPENILLMSTEEPCLIKITDFGMSRLVEEKSLMKTLAGTPSYLAPEIIKQHMGLGKGYTKQVDLWSLGVILYVCLVAFPPFSAELTKTGQSIDEQILSANYSFQNQPWSTVSNDAKNLVSSLLVLNANDRLTTSAAVAHPWLQDSEMIRTANSLMSTVETSLEMLPQTINLPSSAEKRCHTPNSSAEEPTAKLSKC